MDNPVYDDYRQRRFGAYFTASFLHKHLRPFAPVPLGGFAENRSRARVGNVALVERNQNFPSVARNSLIFDFDGDRRVLQVLLLMQEVARRTTEGDYARQSLGTLLRSADDYYVQTTKLGSRQNLSYGPIVYAVTASNGRYVINHLDGVAE